MEIVDSSFITNWIARAGLIEIGKAKLGYKGQNHVITCDFDLEPYGYPILAHNCWHTLIEHTVAGQMLFWVTDWGFGDERREAMCLHTFESMVLTKGLTQSVSLEKRGFLFDSSEIIEGSALSVLPMIYAWSAYIIPPSGGIYVCISEDSYIEIGYADLRQEETILSNFGFYNPVVRKSIL